MKINLQDFLLSHKKTAGFDFVEKIFESNQFVNKSCPGKTFCLTATGAEVHSGKPLVSHVKPVETLKEKIARFEKLEKNLNLIRMRAFVTGAIQFEDDAADFDDFDFANDNAADVDSFGDPFQDSEESSVAEPETGAGKPAQPSMPEGGVSSSPGAALDVPPDDVSSSGMPSQPKVEDVQE